MAARGAATASDRFAIPSTHRHCRGMLSLQVLGAVPQLERALIAERTKSRMKAAKVRDGEQATLAFASGTRKRYGRRPQHSWDNGVWVLNRKNHELDRREAAPRPPPDP